MKAFRILVVDDFEPFRKFLCLTLRQKDQFYVSEASDGLEAVQKAEQLQPDLILLDIGLPNLNGIEVCKCVCSIVPAPKIVFLSQESSAEIVQEALKTGAQGYVQKLYAQRELLPAIDAVLIGKRFVSSGLLVVPPPNGLGPLKADR